MTATNLLPSADEAIAATGPSAKTLGLICFSCQVKPESADTHKLLLFSTAAILAPSADDATSRQPPLGPRGTQVTPESIDV